MARASRFAWSWWLLSFALALGACSGGGSSPSVMPRFDLTQSPEFPTAAETWLSMPFPADHRRLPNGNIKLSDFPNPSNRAQLTEWIADAESTLDGFSLQGMAYFAFDGAIDASMLPTTPAGFLDETSPVYLVDIDPDSPDFGDRIPLRAKYWTLDNLVEGYFVVKNTLGVGPEWGFPLRESNTYAVIITDDLRAADGGRIGQHPLVRALLSGKTTAPRVTPAITQAQYDAIRPTWGLLRSFVNATGVDARHIVTATVFTTQTITRDLDLITAQIEAGPAPTMTNGFIPQTGGLSYFDASYTWNSTQSVNYHVYQGDYVAPNYQEGTMPYEPTGGALHFVGGQPEKVFDESLRFVLTVPDAPPTSGNCYPLVMYQHGTGGSRNSFRNDGTAGRLAARGVAAISIDQPIHGLRNTTGQTYDVNLMTFNFFNAQSFRSMFRQGAIDVVSLTRFVRESLSIPAADSHTGQAISFCPDRVSFMGHSQGGLTGSLIAPFVPNVDSFVLSGAGGGLGITIVHRKDFADFNALISYYLDIPAEEVFDEEHPVSTFIQTMADVSDPISYARYWNLDDAYRPPANVMLTNGRYDEATYYITASSLALAAQMPITKPVVIPVPDYDILGMAPVDATLAAPLSNNRNGATFGFLQFTDDLPNLDYATHYLIFHRPEAIDASMHFLQTASYGTSVELRRDPNADAR